MAPKDMYADLEKIEARGKRKKEKSKGFFSSFGNKDEPEPDEPQSSEPEQTPKPAPAKEPMFSKREETHPTAPAPEPVVQKAQPAHVPTPEPVIQKTHQPAPPIKHETEPPKAAAKSIEPAKPAHKPAEAEPKQKSSWMPLTGGKLNQAEEDLLAYKKWLNKGYKSGVLTKEQCTIMVRSKMIELGLAPPE